MVAAHQLLAKRRGCDVIDGSVVDVERDAADGTKRHRFS
jgi:hypothetical protein